jgi:ParB-like chromosome segregation protein Spo0J
MTAIAVKDIVVDPIIQIRRGNHEPTIRRYMDSFENLPPVDVFQTKEGMLLADGFHRWAAADRLGKKQIDARVHRGSREEALEFAVVANTKNADALSPEERDDGVRRLKQLHPKWSNQEIAQAMSISAQTVGAVIAGDRVAQRVVLTGSKLTSTHYREIARAPEETWEPLAKAADKRGWSRDATALAVRNIRDDRIPTDRREKILAGRADPVVVTPEGQFAVPADVVGRQAREMAANDAVLALERALDGLAKLRLFSASAIAKTAGGERLDRLVEEMPEYISFLQEVLSSAKKERSKLEVLR